jgi:hypothetical protein
MACARCTVGRYRKEISAGRRNEAEKAEAGRHTTVMNDSEGSFDSAINLKRTKLKMQ